MRTSTLRSIGLLALGLLWLGLVPTQAQTTDFRTAASPDYYRAKLKKYLQRDAAVWDYIDIRPDGIRLYASRALKNSGRSEFVLPYAAIPRFVRWMELYPPHQVAKLCRQYPQGTLPVPFDPWPTKPSQKQPLAGMRVAIDPGHLGGDARQTQLEYRFMKLRDPQSPTGQWSFAEGNIALQTAHILAHLLRQAGAEVMLTREGEGHSSFGKTFPEWKKTDMATQLQAEVAAGELSKAKAAELSRASDEDLFHSYFKFRDFRRRAQLINQYQPHAVVVIHFNVDEKNQRDHQGFFQPTSENSNMAFIPGAFRGKDLGKAERRLVFLYKLVSRQIEASQQLSAYTVAEFAQRIGPLEPERSTRVYLDQLSLYTGQQGVYSRNLSLCRDLSAPMVYGESILQDNLAEARRLGTQDTVFEGRPVSSRLVEVAESYFYGLYNFWLAR